MPEKSKDEGELNTSDDQTQTKQSINTQRVQTQDCRQPPSRIVWPTSGRGPECGPHRQHQEANDGSEDLFRPDVGLRTQKLLRLRRIWVQMC